MNRRTNIKRERYTQPGESMFRNIGIDVLCPIILVIGVAAILSTVVGLL